MEWKDIAHSVETAAPFLGSLLRGPAATAVGKLIAAVLGANATPEDVSNALLDDSEIAGRLVELQTNARAELQRLAVMAAQKSLQTQSPAYAASSGDPPRASDESASQPTDWVRPGITATLLLGALSIIIYVFSGRADGLLRDATASLTIGTIIGYWFNELKQTLAFWFGMTRDAAVQAQAITRFAVDPNTVVVAKTIQTLSRPPSAPGESSSSSERHDG
ncbi:hypothetical protein [Chitinasiproducens palmae]|uniref:Uncharacterized protein n=1 Tax=Chitinasiproducens palmae TaxID=1770053 RepID=A0A1H2PRG0_9BURK|nr:hypothetical protein [Chitinasiproducens palmae]SDV49061.1 hypothetical protein SAMN05216551_10731 [Chitinasiproducens palmae]